MSYKEFTTGMIKDIHRDISTAISQIALKWGIPMDANSIKWSEQGFSITVSSSLSFKSNDIGIDEISFHLFKQELSIECDLGFTFRNSSKERHTVVGIDLSDKKYPVITQTLDGRRFKSSVEVINAMHRLYV